MSTPLSAAVVTRIQECGKSLLPVSGFRHTRPTMLSPLPSECGEVGLAIQIAKEQLTTAELSGIEDYHHSSQEDNIDLLVDGFLAIIEKDPLEMNIDLAFEAFVMDVLDMPDTEVEICCMDEATFIDQEQTTSSAGLLPMVTLFGKAVGAKNDMHMAAIAVNMQDKYGTHTPGMLPYKPVLKGEVQKKGKKVRAIQIESQANFMVLKHCFQAVASHWLDPSQGDAIGLSNTNGDYKMMLFNWFDAVRDHLDLDWNGFVEWISGQPAHESDKKSWESSTNVTDGFPYLLSLLCRIRMCECEGCQRLLCRALADYFNPHIQVDGDLVVGAYMRVASGSYLTAHGNTRRHRNMVNCVANYFARHGGVGKAGCECSGCGYIKEDHDFGKVMAPWEIDLLYRAFIMGDDFIGINKYGRVFDKLIDFYFGTTTHFEQKSFLDSEFLRRTPVIEWGETHNVFTKRGSERLFAKLLKGSNRYAVEAFAASVVSAIWECGYDERVYNILKSMYDSFGELDQVKVASQLEKYLRKNPGMFDNNNVVIPSFNLLIDLNASLAAPLYKYVRGRDAKNSGYIARM